MLRPLPVVLALVLAASLVAAQPTVAQEQRGEDGLSDLWQEYPLEQTPAPDRGGSSLERTDVSEPPLLPEQDSAASPLGIAVLLLAIALVLLGLAGGALRLVRDAPSSLGRP